MKNVVKSKHRTRTSRDNEGNMEPRHQRVAAIAYQLYEREGRPEGKALEHWFNAEAMDESQFGVGRNHTERDLMATSDIS